MENVVDTIDSLVGELLVIKHELQNRNKTSEQREYNERSSRPRSRREQSHSPADELPRQVNERPTSASRSTPKSQLTNCREKTVISETVIRLTPTSSKNRQTSASDDTNTTVLYSSKVPKAHQNQSIQKDKNKNVPERSTAPRNQPQKVITGSETRLTSSSVSMINISERESTSSFQKAVTFSERVYEKKIPTRNKVKENNVAPDQTAKGNSITKDSSQLQDGWNSFSDTTVGASMDRPIASSTPTRPTPTGSPPKFHNTIASEQQYSSQRPTKLTTGPKNFVGTKKAYNEQNAYKSNEAPQAHSVSSQVKLKTFECVENIEFKTSGHLPLRRPTSSQRTERAPSRTSRQPSPHSVDVSVQHLERKLEDVSERIGRLERAILGQSVDGWPKPSSR